MAAVVQITRKRYPSLGIDLTQLAADLSTLRSAIAATPTFVGARPEDTQPVRQALAASLADVTSAMAQAETVMEQNGGAVAGVAGSLDDQAILDNFIIYFQVAVQEPDLVDLNSFLTRMRENVVLGGTTCSDTTNLSGQVS